MQLRFGKNGRDLQRTRTRRHRLQSGSGQANDATIRGLKSKVEELTRDLNSAHSTRSRASLSRDRETLMRLADSDRQRAKLEGEVNEYESKVRDLRKEIDHLVSTFPPAYRRED